MKMMDETSELKVLNVSRVNIGLNTLLSIIKLIAGFSSNSAALISDGLHSLSDVFSTFVLLAGIKLANKKADDSHPYGHDKFESIAAIILSFILLSAGIGIGYNGIESLSSENMSITDMPGMFAAVVALTSVILKEGMYQYTSYVADSVRSDSLKADAWHQRSDALSSVGSLIGIIGSRLGYSLLDPLISILIGLMIIKVAISIFISATEKLTDRSCEPSVVLEMEKVILKQEGIEQVDSIKTRLFGSQAYVDVEVGMDGNQSLYYTHKVAHKVHDDIEEQFPYVKHCMVHVNPID